MSITRVIAIDWSGAEKHAADKIWTAEVQDGVIVDLFNGLTRKEIRDYLILQKSRDPRFVVGLDFAFSMPHAFIEALRDPAVASAHALWDGIRDKWEAEWLRGSHSAFWGKVPRSAKAVGLSGFRTTEERLCDAHGTRLRPKSVFQTGGAGAVGTGSIRGMPILLDLHNAGFRIWPFDDPERGGPAVVEIYPRWFTGPVKKSVPAARMAYVKDVLDIRDRTLCSLISCSEDSFDAAVSALKMWQHRDLLAGLPPVRNQKLRLEGIVWNPCWQDQLPEWNEP